MLIVVPKGLKLMALVLFEIKNRERMVLWSICQGIIGSRERG